MKTRLLATQGRSRLQVSCWLLAALFCGGAAPLSRAANGAVVLFNGKDLTGWHTPTGTWSVAKGVSLDPARPEAFVVQPGQGIMLNSANAHTVNLVTAEEFGDAQVHIEFCLPKHSNSGVYLMGRYEVQVYDSYGVEKDKYPGIECGGIYPRWINNKDVEGHSPRVNASKPPGDWQSFDITFRAPRFNSDGKKTANARFMKVVHNGKVIHENVELSGPTRSSMAEDEKATGPLFLQGDHGPVAYRNLWIKALNLK
jgi:hypothetical protein